MFLLRAEEPVAREAPRPPQRAPAVLRLPAKLWKAASGRRQTACEVRPRPWQRRETNPGSDAARCQASLHGYISRIRPAGALLNGIDARVSGEVRHRGDDAG